MKHIEWFVWLAFGITAAVLVALHLVILGHGGWIAAWLYWSLIAGLALGQCLRFRKS